MSDIIEILKERDELQQKIHDLVGKMRDDGVKVGRILKENNDLKAENADLSKIRFERDERICKQEEEIKELKRISGERKTQVKSLESSCSNYQDIASRGVEENNKLKAQLDSAETARDGYKDSAERHKATAKQYELNWHNEERGHGQTKAQLAESKKVYCLRCGRPDCS